MPFTPEHSLRCRSDFPALSRKPQGLNLAYLDGPGGSQVPKPVIDAFADFYATCNVNTHGKFWPSQEVDRRMDQAREVLAAFLGAEDPGCISFGQNMTTLNRGPWLRLKDLGVSVQEVRLLPSGELDLPDLEAKITPRTKVFAVGASSNALGTVNDLALARRLTAAVGALLVVDAVHYAPHFPLDVKTLGVDFLLCSGYKFYGPHVGVLYSRSGALAALPTDRLSVQDPAAPYRIETGTLNHAAIDALRVAVQYLASWGAGGSLRERIVDAMTSISAYEHSLAKFYHDAVRELPGVRVWGPDFSRRARAPTVSITLSHATAGAAAQALGKEGICVWDGNFYAARAVEILGLNERGGLLRTGVSMYSSREDLERLLAGIAKLR
jgi:selenocysteine lyase/cysteine desulfurase